MSGAVVAGSQVRMRPATDTMTRRQRIGPGVPVVWQAPALGLVVMLLSWSSASAQQTVTVRIGPGRDENTGTGTATLTAMGQQTQVVVRVAATNREMLGHIHADVCPGVGPVVFPLTNPVNGVSTTVINQPLAQVLAQGKSINLHKSPQQGMIYVGCGNLAAAATGGWS